jgi:signal peptidase II
VETQILGKFKVIYMNYKKFVLPLIIMVLVILSDRMTKVWAVETLKGYPSQSYLGDSFRIIYAENEGAFLSLGSDLPENVRFWVLAIIPILALGYFGFTLFFNNEVGPWQRIAFAFIIAGGGSNIIDRILEGKVVDFLNIGIGDLRSGIFNIADMAIMAGLFLILPMAFKSSAPKKQESVPSEGENAFEIAIENAEIKAIEEETEEPSKENKGE